MMAIDWEAYAQKNKKARANHWPVSHPRIATCRSCGQDAAGSGLLYCMECRADMTTEQLLTRGEYHGDWEIATNRFGNAIWQRAEG